MAVKCVWCMTVNTMSYLYFRQMIVRFVFPMQNQKNMYAI